MYAHVHGTDAPPEKCPNCGERTETIVAEKTKVSQPDYEAECRELQKEVSCLKRELEKAKFDVGITERDREILKAQMEVVRLIFGGRRDD